MSRKILIVDDEKTFSELLKFNLESTGKYKVKIENSGLRGFDRVLEYKPDLILLDLMMPDMPGDKIAYQLRNHKDTKNIPIILLTAIITGEETKKHNNVLGNYTVVAKPVDIDKLIAIIDKTL